MTCNTLEINVFRKGVDIRQGQLTYGLCNADGGGGVNTATRPECNVRSNI